ncbi:MAG: hypothetical protein K2X49_15145 [Acetobacteraceae bacterium]|nr:hypothetical protein [Acetobacteraceae bacterium]
MQSLITRLYRNPEQAAAAAAALRAQWFPADAILVIAPWTEPGPAAAALARFGVSDDAARAHARRVQEGAAAVTVRAPFGQAVPAMRILDRFDPIEADIEDEFQPAFERAAPLSAALGLRVLLRDPAPLSEAIGLRVLSRRQNPDVALIHNPAPLTDAFFVSPLGGGPAPLSRLFGLPLLSRVAAPLSRMLGFRTLSQEAAPLSARLGLRTLARHPAPLSALFRLPVLLRR